MQIQPATETDISLVVELANAAYRGRGPVTGWTDESAYIGGSRITAELLARDLETRRGATLLVCRERPGSPLAGCVWLEREDADRWYLGLLTVRPDLQDKGLGRQLLAAAEAHAVTRGARRIRMTVVHLRDTLIAWYERRGYVRTGETEPFPYEDSRFGEPRRDDLHFIVLEKLVSAPPPENRLRA